MPPRDDEDVLTRERHFRVAGAVLSTLAILGLVFVIIICNLPAAVTGSTPPPRQSYGIPVGCAAFVVALLGGITWYHWRRHRSRAFAMGLLIGVGIAALIEGACFVITSR